MTSTFIQEDRTQEAGTALIRQQRADALAVRLQEHRDLEAMSQQDMSDALGISRPTLSKLERGCMYPSRLIRNKLARYFGVHPAELLLIAPGEKHEDSIWPPREEDPDGADQGHESAEVREDTEEYGT